MNTWHRKKKYNLSLIGCLLSNRAKKIPDANGEVDVFDKLL